MKRAIVIALSTATAVAMGACGSAGVTDVAGGESIDEQTGGESTTVELRIDENASRLSGMLRTVDGSLAFDTINVDANTIKLVLVVNWKRIDATIDDVATAIDGHDAVLTAADRRLFTTFIDQYAVRFAGTNAAERDLSLNRLALYLSEAPEGHVHGAITRGESTPDVAALTAAPAGGDEGVKCIKKGTTVTAVYTDKSGKTTQEPIVVGSKMSPMPGGNGDYSCMGKCGAGCTDYWFAKTGYTKDCLDHDACSRKYTASGGARDPNCGDEYNAASRDFTNSKSCTGN
ncbi:MAG: hypothetical protein ABW133_08360 [Polyangiaceae bacterium]